MLFGGSLFQGLGERLAVENIVAQNQTDVVVADKFFADDECLCQAVRAGLLGIADGDAEIAAVTQQSSERRDCRSGVVMTKISRIPASINTDRG